MTKQLRILLFVAAFGLVAAHSAAGQSDSHVVTVNVAKVEALSAYGNPTIEVGAGELKDDVKGDATGKLSVTTNVHENRKVTVQANSIDSKEALGNIGLRVDIPDAGGEIKSNGGKTEILGFGTADRSGNVNVARDLTAPFQTVYQESVDLVYEAKVNEDYNPKNQTRVQVKYTLVSTE
jgi:hypothetical protein